MIKLPKKISGCGEYGKAHLAGQKYQAELINSNLRHLLSMWGEVCLLGGNDEISRMDCIIDLTKILQGDLSPIELIEGQS